VNATPRQDPLRRLRTQLDALPGLRPEDRARREAAFARFFELGFPAANDEDWKYTNLRRLESRSFAAATRRDVATPDLPVLAAIGAPRMLIVDGFVNEEAHGGPLAGVRRLHDAADRNAWRERRPHWPSGGGTERFAALNAAFADDPVLLDVRATSGPAPVLHIACVATGEATAAHPRISVYLAPGAQLRLVLEHASDGQFERWVNCFVDADVAEGATLELYRLQRHGALTFHTERIDVRAARGGRVIVCDASLGGTLARLDLNVELAGPQAVAELSGLFLADGKSHLDTHARVDHRAVGTTSLQEYRGIAAGRGRGIFNTTVFVHRGAAKSNARQSSRNLLLSSTAEIDTKPELQIHTDDVQCAHGATTGQLDPQAMFYLQSRGIDRHEARRLLTRAFAASVLNRMSLAGYAAAVHELVDARLLGLLEETAP
jgi:Fe-S cluster assembly protein SufD